MCGVAGYLGRVADEANLVANMTSAIAHRGPDREGICVFEQAGLPHTEGWQSSIPETASSRCPVTTVAS
ncbi:MAG: Asparagine synthetase [Rhizobium sp.]|nr:Asparagine synthetase [Rhizobium sp.]